MAEATPIAASQVLARAGDFEVDLFIFASRVTG